MHVGIIGCRELVPQPWKLAEKFPEELDALHHAVTTRAKKPGAKKAPAKKAAKKSAARKNTANIG
jgi:hypothetical protein